MTKFRADLKDIRFNLFDYLQIEKYSDSMEKADLDAILEEYNKFTANEIFPTRTPSDEEGVKLTDEGVKVPECLHKVHNLFNENGWIGLGYPEEIGGIPVPEGVRVACESISTGANTAWSMYPGLSRGALNVILAVGSDEQKAMYVEKMVTGQWGGTMCLTEPNAGSDVGALKSTAKPLGDGKYSIKGVKIFISSGESDLYENNVHLVLSRTPDGEEGTKGLSLFIVPRYKVNEDGSIGESNDVHCTKVEEKMGLHAQATCEMTFGAKDNCEGWLIGKEFDGIQNMFLMMNEARLLCGIQGESQGNLAYEMALNYAKERSQFGKEIIHHPDVKRMLIKMRALGRGMRGLALYVGSLFDEHHKNKDEAVLNEIGLLTPVCKAYFTDEGVNMSVEAIQVLGGYGYCSEYGVEQFLRDAKVAQIYEGTNGIQAIDYVMRKILKDQGKTFMALGAKMQATLENPLSEEFEKEKRLLFVSIGKAGEIAQLFGKRAQKGEFDAILQHATDFLTYSSHVAVGWILMDHALKAKSMLGSAQSEDDKKYLTSKIEDFKVYFQHYLTKNIGIGKGILQYEQDLTDIHL